MKCMRCAQDFQEKFIQESHDVPCYLFDGYRKERKQQADIFGRRWLCQGCHKLYEGDLQIHLRECAFKFAHQYFKKEEENGGI